MQRIFVFILLLLVASGRISFADQTGQDPEINQESKQNYIGFTPTFILMGMYGLVYSRAVSEKLLLTAVGGYTNFDLSPFPFLSNEDWIYQNAYLGANITYFPLSESMFPQGFYVGADFALALGFWENRDTHVTGTDLGISFDVLAGYSWIIADFLKISVDVFLNFNAPGIYLSGVKPNEDDEWFIMPFFDVNIGLLF